MVLNSLFVTQIETCNHIKRGEAMRHMLLNIECCVLLTASFAGDFEAAVTTSRIASTKSAFIYTLAVVTSKFVWLTRARTYVNKQCIFICRFYIIHMDGVHVCSYNYVVLWTWLWFFAIRQASSANVAIG